MECKHCGSYMENDAPYCKKCGMSQNEFSSKVAKISKLDAQLKGYKIKKDKGKNPILIILIILFTIPTIYLGYILIKSLTETTEEIESKRQSRAVSSANAVLEAGRDFITEAMLSGEDELEDSYTFICNGNSCVANVNGTKEKLVIEGTVPTAGRITVDKKTNVTIKETLIIDGYKCKQKKEIIECNK